jgi:two-component system sensor histidine kinase KdpD
MNRHHSTAPQWPQADEATPRHAISAIAATASLALIVVLTALATSLRLNHTSAGFLLLIGVLIVASRQPLLVATSAAILATLLYNYFFFEPIGTFHIEDPENWIALVTFLATSVLANRLLVRARMHAEVARAGRADSDALYELSVELLRGSGGMAPIGEAAVRYLSRLGATSGGLILFGASPQQQSVVAWHGEPATSEVEEIAAGAGRHRQTTSLPSRFGHDHCVPIIVSGRARAALLARGSVSLNALESASNILSFALEREEFLEGRAHVAALRESNELKTSLLQAVAHDLKSPLTVLRVESEALDRKGAGQPGTDIHVRAIRDEVARLNRRIDNLLSVARVEGGIITPRFEPTPPADLFRAARESLHGVTTRCSIRTSLDHETPDVMVDPSLALEIVVNLIENAEHAAPDGSTVELFARVSPEAAGRVWLEVADRGAGMPTAPQRSGAASSNGQNVHGLGMELARKLAAVNGGTVEWFARPGGGTIARVDLPSALLEASS